MAFTVDKAVHEKLLSMLDALDAVCKKLNIRYYLCYGSAIGAMREKGFIPWDEDIDVCLWRDDFECLRNEAQALLPDGLFLQNTETDPHYPFQFMKLTDPATALIYEKFRRIDMVQGISIDLCPIDLAPDGVKAQDKQHRAAVLLNRILAFDSFPSKKVGLLLKVVPKRVAVRHFEKKIRRYNRKNTGTVYITLGDNRKERFMPKDFFGTPRSVEFAGRMVPVPEKAEEYLTWCFGDYMTPPPPADREKQSHFAIDPDKSYKEYLK